MARAVLIRDHKLELIEAPQKPTLQWMQSQVEGYIEHVFTAQNQYLNERRIVVVGNEEARLIPMPPNVYRQDGEVLCGPLVVLVVHREDHWSLTQQEAERVTLVETQGRPLPVLVIQP